jgi:hypothetical protein
MISVFSQPEHSHSMGVRLKKRKYYVFPSQERLTNNTMYKKAKRHVKKCCVWE